MSKWLCQLPWLAACAAMVAFGTLSFIGYLVSDKPRNDDEEVATPGCALLLAVFGMIGLVAWAVVAFAVK